MCKLGHRRETVFLDRGKTDKRYPVRYIYASKSDILRLNMDKFQFNKRDYRIYHSIEQFDHFPMFSFNMKQRKIQGDEWKQNIEDKIIECDFVLDLDYPDFHFLALRETYPRTPLNEIQRQAVEANFKHKDKKKSDEYDYRKQQLEAKKDEYVHADATKIKNKFDEWKLPYSITFSGNKGYHFRISGKHFPFWKPADKIQQYETLAKRLQIIFNTKCIDETIYDHRRILKTPYSLDGDNVVLPLTDQQFQTMATSRDPVKINHVLNNIRITRRGLLERNPDNTKAIHTLIDRIGDKKQRETLSIKD